jgi:hypothetical protein
VPRARYLIPGIRYLIPGIRYLMPGTWYPGTWYLVPVPGTRYLVHGIWYQVLGAPDTWYRLSGTSYLVPGGPWYQVSYTRYHVMHPLLIQASPMGYAMGYLMLYPFGARYRVPGARRYQASDFLMPGIRYLMLGAWYQERTACLAPGSWHLVSGTRYQAPGIW